MFAIQEFKQLAPCALRLSAACGLPVQLVASIDSTNSALLASAGDCPVYPQPPCALIALTQTAGRGRRGRDWHSGDVSSDISNHTPPAFLASLGVRTLRQLPQLGLLPLHIGAAVVQQLRAWGCAAQLKWPNDIVIDTAQGNAKLGGILVETRSLDGFNTIVMGMGLNWHRAPPISDRQVACVATLANAAPDSEAAAAALLAAMHLGWQRTMEQRACDFSTLDALYGKAVTSSNHQGECLHGIARGINPLGHLGVHTDAGMVWLHSGEVSVRPAP